MNIRDNTLFAHLPDSEVQCFLPHIQLVSLVKGQVLWDCGQQPSHVYYPIGAVVSMMHDQKDGYSVESNMFGKTCMVGVAAIGQASFYRAQVRSSGLAYRMAVEDFLQVRTMCPVYVQGAEKALQSMFRQLSQAVVCGKMHALEQQLTRWLLTTLDRTFRDEIEITHNELSEILGVRREAVTLMLGRLFDSGMVSLSRGEIAVLHREGLEALACDCYWLNRGTGRQLRLID